MRIFSAVKQSGQEVGREQVQNVPLELFHPFPNHPFKVLDDEKMQDTVQSISEFGVLVPVLARPRPEGGYEIVSGHRRIHASELAGHTEVPAIIRNMTDDEAILIMVDSNLQREQILPSEKAFAYKMKLEAMNRQGMRTDLTCSQVGNKLKGRKTSDILADQVGESKNQIFRYVRLTHLIQPILDMVDQNSFALNAAVEISYLPEEHQNALLGAMDYAQVSPSLAQARRIRAFSDSGKLDANVLDAILSRGKAAGAQSNTARGQAAKILSVLLHAPPDGKGYHTAAGGLEPQAKGANRPWKIKHMTA